MWLHVAAPHPIHNAGAPAQRATPRSRSTDIPDGASPSRWCPPSGVDTERYYMPLPPLRAAVQPHLRREPVPSRSCTGLRADAGVSQRALAP
ncbi:hypothetical protein IMZ48_08370 [Candidatus Bathyarchaeota archaeon]|nr:hypothetical protein [Candidatus Bathyarchaeota archaeon]